MKAVFGILSLLIVLAVLAIVAKRQLHSVAVVPSVAGVGASVPAGPNTTVADQARALEDQVRDQATRAVQQGADRAASADQ